jgi:hypothetical protein
MSRESKITDAKRLQQVNSVHRSSDNGQRWAVRFAIVCVLVWDGASKGIQILHDLSMSIRIDETKERLVMFIVDKINPDNNVSYGRLPKRAADVDVFLQQGLIGLERQDDLGIRILHCLQDQGALLVFLLRFGWSGGVASSGRSMLSSQFIDPRGDGSHGKDLAMGQGRV